MDFFFKKFNAIEQPKNIDKLLEDINNKIKTKKERYKQRKETRDIIEMIDDKTNYMNFKKSSNPIVEDIFSMYKNKVSTDYKHRTNNNQAVNDTISFINNIGGDVVKDYSFISPEAYQYDLINEENKKGKTNEELVIENLKAKSIMPSVGKKRRKQLGLQTTTPPVPAPPITTPPVPTTTNTPASSRPATPELEEKGEENKEENPTPVSTPATTLNILNRLDNPQLEFLYFITNSLTNKMSIDRIFNSEQVIETDADFIKDILKKLETANVNNMKNKNKMLNKLLNKIKSNDKINEDNINDILKARDETSNPEDTTIATTDEINTMSTDEIQTLKVMREMIDQNEISSINKDNPEFPEFNDIDLLKRILKRLGGKLSGLQKPESVIEKIIKQFQQEDIKNLFTIRALEDALPLPPSNPLLSTAHTPHTPLV